MSLLGNILGKVLHPTGERAQAAQVTEATAKPSLPAGSVDVDAVLSGMASGNAMTLDWQHSIVDLMKLLDLDSSLAARKQLANELGYVGEKDGSASMNIWLHKQVISKLEENGGKVPDSLKH
jgi:hypothetical protein